MTRKRVFKVALWVIVICVSVFIGVLTLAAYISESKHYLPTHSKANELRVAKYGFFVTRGLRITLNCEGGDSYVLEVKNHVQAGEPQYYSLPDLPDGSVTVNIALDSDLKCDTDVMRFNNYFTDDLKRDGLLIYFSDTVMGIYVISGKTTVCYVPSYSSYDWVALANPPPISRDPFGWGGFDWDSGWRDNKWEYIQDGNTSVIRGQITAGTEKTGVDK